MTINFLNKEKAGGSLRDIYNLEDPGGSVVESAKSGREVRYTLSPATLAASLRSLADALEACCPPDQPTDAGSEAAGPENDGLPPTPTTEV